MIRISVIIPVYNVEEYLRDALDSILNQTMIDDIEVIMVNDGSTDNSKFIIDEYAENYENFHAFHKKNEGQGIARNFGLELARGEYIHFMDADDYLPPKAYENLYYFNPYNDFVVGNVLKFGEYNIWENILFKNAFKDFNGDVRSFKLTEYPKVLWDTITCNKLFKKAFLDKYNIRFINKDIYYEDLLFSLQAYIFAESIGFSRSIFYFWRLRKDKSSITQKENDVKNFYNRIEILNIYNSIMERCELPDYIKNVVYSKWLVHDLKTSLKKIRNYPGKYYSELLAGTNDLLNIIPSELKGDLNFYLKILYKMVENNDLNSLLLFAHLENELKQDPKLPQGIGKEYLDQINLSSDYKDGELEAHLIGDLNDNRKLYLEFSENLEFAPVNHPHKTEAFLIGRDKNVPLKIRKDRIVIPLDALKDENHLKIQLSYETKDFKKVALLKNYSRKSVRFEDYDVDLNIGINNILYLDVRKRNENQIFIKDVIFDDEEFIFKCETISEVKNIILTNYVTFRQVRYSPIYSKKFPNVFIFVIPYSDISNNIINKWEINSPESLNSIKLVNEFRFIYGSNEIKFRNKRNKVFISNRISSRADDEIDEIKMKNEKLINANNQLSDDNIHLNKNIEEYKSRKSVQMVDNIKNIFK